MKDDYTQLARKAIKTYLTKKETLIYNKSDFLSKKKAGVFVSLHDKKNNNLLGCIGTYKATRNNLAKEIIENAISAATQDPRFTSIKISQLKNIKISVDILSSMTNVKDINKLNPKDFGVFVVSTDHKKSALLLPDLEGIETTREQLSIVLQKAGLGFDEDFEIYKFKVQRHQE